VESPLLLGSFSPRNSNDANRSVVTRFDQTLSPPTDRSIRLPIFNASVAYTDVDFGKDNRRASTLRFCKKKASTMSL